MASGGVATRPVTGRWRRCAATALVGATALCAGPELARADTGPLGVRPGNNITVFHNIDMVATFGHAVGAQVQVDVFRAEHRIATARGRAVDAGPEGGALEVNHGPEGVPQPGDCFDGATPDIRPGDRIVVSNPGGRAGVDEAIVDDIGFNATPVKRLWVNPQTGKPAEFVPVLDENGAPTDETVPAPGSREEVWVEGTASLVGADGSRSPMPVSKLDSGGFIDPADNQLRLGPNVIDAPLGDGTFRERYWAPFAIERNRAGHSNAYIMNALESGESHELGYGHTDVLPPASMLIDGFGEQAGPAPGCESAPKEASSVGTVSVDELTAANSDPSAPDLVVGGWAAGTVDSAKVVLSNGAQSLEKAVDMSAGPDARGWSAAFTQSELADLGDGTLSARLTVDDTPVGATRIIRRDTAPPVSTPATPDPEQAPTTVPASAPGIGVLGVVDARAAVPVIGSLAPAGEAVTARVRGLSAPARVARSAARRRGVVTSFVTPAGARYAQVRVYRLGGGERRLLATRVMAATPGRRQTARFTSASIRRRLAAGRYAIEVRTGASPARLGPAEVALVRVAR
jgi:hypothetical protein